LGLTPTLSGILDLKQNSGDFFNGFIEGTQMIADFLSPVVDLIFKAVDFISNLAKSTEDLTTATSTLDVPKWERFGKAVAFIGTALLLWNFNPVVLGIALVAGGIMWVINNWDLLKEKAVSAINAIKEAFVEFGNIVMSLLPDWAIKLINGGSFTSTLFTPTPQPYSQNGGGGSGAFGLATGGFIRGSGLAFLHPNEVVVNDNITRRLDSFLSDRDSLGVTQSSSRVTQDNSVVFEKGSIIMNFEGGGTEEEAETFVSMVIQKIERLQQLKRIANYQPAY